MKLSSHTSYVHISGIWGKVLGNSGKRCSIPHRVNNYVERKATEIVSGWSFLWVLRMDANHTRTERVNNLGGICVYCEVIFFLKGSVSWDFQPPFFSWFEPIWAPDKQAKVSFSNPVLILLRYSIAKFTPRNPNFRLSKSKFFSSNLFFHDTRRCVHP